MTAQVFPRSVVEDVANDRSVDAEELEDALADVQESLRRDDGGYEYSSEQHFAWSDDDAFFLYGADDAWSEIAGDQDLSASLADAVREVHARTMLESASERGQEPTVRETLDDGNEPIVVDSIEGRTPGFGQDV